jgi:cytochrome P450
MSGANKLVWTETLQQTRRLSESWSQATSRDLLKDVNSLTLAVISLAGLGRRINWTSASDEEIPEGYKMSFFNAMAYTTGNMISILLLPGWLLRLSPLRKAGVAYAQLEKYLREMIRAEKEHITVNKDHQSKTAKGNLLTEVLKASASEGNLDKQVPGSLQRKDAFSEDEIMGNLFVYLLAGKF